MSDPVIDPVVFSEMQELMEEALEEFIVTYLENSPKLLQEIARSLPAAELESIYHNAHQLKGGSGSIGAMQVFQIAKQLEEKARAGQKDGLDGLYSELQAAYDRVESELRAHIT